MQAYVRVSSPEVLNEDSYGGGIIFVHYRVICRARLVPDS